MASRSPRVILPTLFFTRPLPTQELSGLRDRAAEGLERDVGRLRAAALTGVQAVDGGHLVGA